MHTQILSPLLRSTIGFDRFDRLFEAAAHTSPASRAYPPYNIEKTGENDYRISMAVAGFSLDELDVTQRENLLVIAGKPRGEDEAASYLHRGIAGRGFERRFELAETIKVVDAKLELGLLHVDLVREIPESKRPRKIEILAGKTPQVEAKKAA